MIARTWEPADAERSAAWESYLELITRVSVEELAPDEGFLREALSSLCTALHLPTSRSGRRPESS
ncbi:hypothetical protein ACIQPR_31645 [Streptomyces sp. NPDC091280]|uniref:hypothetical protein n=1 Tax=Streptomyces sp. NPDC091280 TaxID=3365984 RepID=UPI0038031C9A